MSLGLNTDLASTKDVESGLLDDNENDDFEFEHFFDGEFGKTRTLPSHDEPSISGLE